MNWDIIANVTGCVSCFFVGFAIATRMKSKEYIEIEENIDKIKLLQRRKQDEN